ncbi:MAG: mannose-1-phosphate guanylyltransferase/mannose-6-phosphate isomerase [Candidatus Moranbacteria bacterium]|nr:mannose-1-phosphate guanylyltransferase/mannose-6-phosphate isomerase [Candidatus Moranbacteria bacterium]
MYAVILCGGSGTRLWPLSRKNFPKQFLSLYSDKSLLQETYLRVRQIMPSNHIFFVTNNENLFNVVNQIRDIDEGFEQSHVLIEPTSLNTAPAILYAMKHLIDEAGISEDVPVAFLPADHYIGNKEAFVSVLQKAAEKVGDAIGTIGVVASKPETGYGYIKRGKVVDGYAKADAFKEKPDRKIAEEYVASGKYDWNSGMYIFNAKTFFSEIAKHAPELSAAAALKTAEFLEAFSTLPALSIDNALSEKSDKVVVFEGSFDWNDIGSFDSLAEIAETNDSIETRHIEVDSKNVFVHSTSNRLVATLGVEDIIVIENNDSILIQKRGRSEDVKKLVEKMKADKAKELDHQLVGYRPWGRYEVLLDTPTHKVKKIIVYPGAKLSLQSHFHRAEHWVVVRGTAKIVNGEKETYLSESESTYVPKTHKHRLENPGKEILEIIEVQTGTYLEEDDIVRYDDQYNRK